MPIVIAILSWKLIVQHTLIWVIAHLRLTDRVINICIIKRMELMCHIIIFSKCYYIHTMTMKLWLKRLCFCLCFYLILKCSFSANKKCFKWIRKVRDCLLEFLSFVCLCCISGDISEDNDIECLIHPIALFISHKIYVFFLSNNSLIDLILSPLFKIEDQIKWEIDRVIEMQLQVNIKFAAIEDKAISNSHGVNKCSSQLFYCLILCDFSEIDA